MRILLINQVFYPDIVSTSQHLTDLALAFVKKGHEVTVFSSRHGYDDPRITFSKRENYQGIDIERISHTAFGKKSLFCRFLDFLTFILGLFLRLCAAGKQDIVVALTSPPLVGVLASWFCRFKGGKLVHWVMDLNPDQAIAAGCMKADGLAAFMMKRVVSRSFRRSTLIVALDRFAKNRIRDGYKIDASKIRVLPPWAHDENLRPIRHEDNDFRKMHMKDHSFVIMYSGNHSPCHPLDTILEAALRMREDRDSLFYFIGGGSLVSKVRKFKEDHALQNIHQMGYVPLSRLSESLSAADMHLVVMGEPYVGIVHPCKTYGILSVGRPFVFIGPDQSHIGDFIRRENLGYQTAHGDAAALVRAIRTIRTQTLDERELIRKRSLEAKERNFSQKGLCGQWIEWVEGLNA